MKAFILATALALLVTPALAVPYCDLGQSKDGKVDYGFGTTIGEQDSAARYEQMLNGEGIAAHDTRFWNGCIQTFVKVDGRDQMRFYNPDSLSEMPAN